MTTTINKEVIKMRKLNKICNSLKIGDVLIFDEAKNKIYINERRMKKR
jgi:DNA-binding Xre family transcriptional regulator